MGIGAILGGLGGLIGGGSSLLSGLFGGGSTSGLEDALTHSAQLQFQAQEDAIRQQQQALAEARQYMQPYYQAGTQGLGQYMNMLGLGAQGTGYDPSAWLSQTPGYNWMLGQGVSAMDKSAAARGLLGSGAEYKGLMNYGQNLAMNKAYAPYMSSLQGLGAQGQNAAALQGSQGLGVASNISNLTMQGAQTQSDLAQQMAMANMLGSQQNWNRTMGGLGIMSGTLMNPMFTNALGNMWGGGGGGTPSSSYTGLDWSV
jgi:hypothetical protein